MEIPRHDTPSRDILAKSPGDFPGLDPDAVATCMTLLRVAKRTLEAFYAHFIQYDISPGKYSVLMELYALPKNTDLSPSQIADRIGVTRPTITGLIDGLERQGYVKRIEAARDRRSYSVRLTPKGRRFLNELLPVQFHKMAALVSDLTPTRRSQLTRLLETVEARVGEVTQSPARAAAAGDRR
jgi:DNA-binding MarR family transcriptional regulator